MIDPNPYEASHNTIRPTSTAWRHTLAMVLLMLLAFPAGGVAFFATCYGAVVVAEGANARPDTTVISGLGLGLIAGLVVIAGMFYLAIKLRKDGRTIDEMKKEEAS